MAYVLSDKRVKDRAELCEQILRNDLALVSVEISTKSMIRSVRDRKITLMGKISNLGML